VAALVASTWWFLRNQPRGVVWAGTLAMWFVLALFPWLVDRTSLAELTVLSLVTCAALPAKLVDGASAPEVWRRRPWRDWLVFLAVPFVVCFRGHLRDPERPREESLRFVVRGVFEMLAGVVILYAAFTTRWRNAPVEFVSKLVGVYLAALDGPFVLATGLLRLSGFTIHDLSRHPLLATTPADFWRRYNRDAGRFLFENLFRRLPLKNTSVRTIIVFFANGLVHDYLVATLGGRAMGWMTAFFSVQGIATVITAKWKPEGHAAIAGWAMTLLFMIASSTLLFASIQTLLP
jgi:hypothetical protein